MFTPLTDDLDNLETFSLKRFKTDEQSEVDFQSDGSDATTYSKWIGGFAFDYEKYFINPIIKTKGYS